MIKVAHLVVKKSEKQKKYLRSTFSEVHFDVFFCRFDFKFEALKTLSRRHLILRLRLLLFEVFSLRCPKKIATSELANDFFSCFYALSLIFPRPLSNVSRGRARLFDQTVCLSVSLSVRWLSIAHRCINFRVPKKCVSETLI